MPSSRERSLIASLGGLARSARYDGRDVTGNARQAFRDQFIREAAEQAAHAGEELSDSELLRRAEALRRLFYRRLSYQGVKARSARKGGASRPSTSSTLQDQLSSDPRKA
jgi:hypothetical protein